METLSTEEMQERLDQFSYIMQEKFLLGEDNLDYSKIDEDETLDDHWIKEANYDAEEKYFDDDWALITEWFLAFDATQVDSQVHISFEFLSCICC